MEAAGDILAGTGLLELLPLARKSHAGTSPEGGSSPANLPENPF